MSEMASFLFYNNEHSSDENIMSASTYQPASDLTSFLIKLSDECFPPFGRMHTSGAGDLVSCQ